jgi:hypothetical protein
MQWVPLVHDTPERELFDAPLSGLVSTDHELPFQDSVRFRKVEPLDW